MTAGRRWMAARALAVLGCLIAASLAVAPAALAAPANDSFANATALSSFGSSGTTVGATTEPGEPDHAGIPSSHSVWFFWEPESSGPVSISACSYTENSPDTVLAVYTGMSLGSLVPVASNDDSPLGCKSIASEVEFDATANTKYWIAVDSKDGKDGIFSLATEGPSANDAFATPKVLLPEGAFALGSTVFASKESGEPDHAGNPGGHSLWFSWTPTSSGPVEFTTCGGTPGIDTLLGIYTGSSVNALTTVAASDDAAGKEPGFCERPGGYSRVRFDAVAGTTYRIAVDTKGTSGRVELVSERAQAADSFAGARVLGSFLPWDAVSGTEMATKEPGEPDHAGNPGGHSIWFTWTAPSSGPVEVSACPRDATLDTLLAVYTGSAVDALTPIAANDDSPQSDCHSSGSETQIAAVAGTTYRIAVDGKGGSEGEFDLFLEGKEGNDEFAQAQTLWPVPWLWAGSSNRFAGKESGEPDHAGNPGGQSVWFKWTAPSSGPFSVDTCGSSFDTLLAVYSGSAVGGLTPLAGNDDAGGRCGPQSELSFAAVAGTTYRIAVDGKAGAQGRVKLHLGGQLENDDFDAAELIGSESRGAQLGTTLLATKQAGEPDHAGEPSGHSLWYSWTAARSGVAELDLCSGSFDPVLSVYTGGAVDALTPVAVSEAGSGRCEDSSADSRGLVFAAVGGTTYRIAVAGAAGNDGNFELWLRGPAPRPRLLTVARAGAGAGRVGSAPAGITCGVSCRHAFEDGATVTLSAAPAAGSRFAGWSGGGCSGSGTCQLTLGADTVVTASFEALPGSGGGGGSSAASTAPTFQPPRHKSPRRSKCRRGFKLKTVHGKRRCVKKKARHRH